MSISSGRDGRAERRNRFEGLQMQTEHKRKSHHTIIRPSPRLLSLLHDKGYGLTPTSRPVASLSKGWLESAISPLPSLPAILGDGAITPANTQCYVNASTQHSPIGLTNAMAQGDHISALISTEEKVPLIKEPLAQEAIQSPSIALPQVSSPRQPIPLSSLASQPLAGKQQLSQDHTHLSSPKSAAPAYIAVKILPVQYELCSIEDLVVLIASMVTELIEINDQLPLRENGLTRFHSRSVC
jgi:hypothetical protein